MKLTVFLAVVGVAGWLFFQDQFRSKLRSTVETKINEALAGTGVEASIGNAHFFDGKGMLLSNMRTTAPNVSLTAYETLLKINSNTTDLVTGNAEVDGIEMRRVQLEIFSSPKGGFDFKAVADLAAAIKNATKGEETRLIPIVMLDSQVRLIDKAAGIDKTISDINLRITPVEHEGRTILQVVAAASTAKVQQVMLKGFADPESGEWNTELTLNGANVDSDLLSLLPPSIQQQLGTATAFSSRIDGSLLANGNWRNNAIHWFEGNGKIVDIAIRHQRLPNDIRGAKLNFQINPNGATLSEISGQIGPSPFAAHFNCVDLLNLKSWRLAGRLDQFKLEESMIRALPKSRQFMEDFQPRGLFDVQFEYQFDGNRITKHIDTQISNLAFNFARFPYPVAGCTGTARWVNDHFSYDLKHESRGRIMTAKGFVDNPGKLSTWRCILNVEKGQLPFDPKLQVAIDANPPLAKIVREFNAHGWVAGNALLQKPTPHAEVQKRFNIDLVDMTMRHKRFPYTIENIKGKITTIDKSIRFDQISGSKASGRIVCNGTWNPQTGLNVRCDCNNIELNEELRSALRTELQEVWDGFRPRGTVNAMTVDMMMPPGKKEINVVLDSTLNGVIDGIRTSNLSIYPTWLPYELDNLVGKLVVGNGMVQLRNFQGQHGRTFASCNGDGSYSPEGWHVRLSDVLTRSLRADQQLLSALPESLSRPIQYMKLDGLLNMTGTMTLAGQYRKPAPQYANAIPNQANQPYRQTNQGTFVQQASAAQSIESNPAPKVSMGWDLRLDMNQAKMFLGIPVENVFGKFDLIGEYDGDQVQCRGSVDLDSLTIYDAQITNIKGPVWFDNYQALAGGLINELSTDRTSPSIEGEMYGGVVKLDAAISSDREGRFVIQTSLADGNLKQLSQELSPGIDRAEGRTFAALKMQGDASGTHTCRGTGQIHLRDGKIYELPSVMRLLKLLQVRKLNDVAFDSGDIFFDVNGENIDINRMEFNGDAISIIGNGRVTLDHELDLNFYSVVGRNRINIPLISDLYRRSSQKFLWINVGGTSQDPEITQKILPELNDSLRQLFQQDIQ